MNLLESILTGKTARPRRLTLYGVPGIGKSTFASQAPAPIFIQTEQGLDDIGAARFPLAKSWSDVLDALTALTGEHGYKTAVIDSLSALEPLVWKHTCTEKGKQNIEDFGYGKGYILALDQWRELAKALDYLCEEKHMNVVLIGHSKVTRFNDPEGDAYDLYDMDLNKHAAQAFFRWSDEVLFANYEVIKATTGDGLRKRVIGVDSDRKLWTCERPSHKAKNRLGMPEVVPMAWSEYAKYMAEGATAEQ
jgi:hypothetical protein